MGLLRKVNMLTDYLTEFVWTCFIKYLALNIVCMTFCLLYSASAMTCVIGLTRLYYPNITVIYTRNLFCQRCVTTDMLTTDACMFVACILINWIELNWTVCWDSRHHHRTRRECTLNRVTHTINSETLVLKLLLNTGTVLEKIFESINHPPNLGAEWGGMSPP